MADLKKGVQRGDTSETVGVGNPRGDEAGEHDRGAQFGTSERAERGTDGDLDRRGTSKNQGHGHPRPQRSHRGE
ncbi:MAG TPA: hypothetical protein VFL93_02195 [Longimicrobiaceae bacterium]|nr:hypothetical protein [Longimicrobiaceae bacterium]